MKHLKLIWKIWSTFAGIVSPIAAIAIPVYIAYFGDQNTVDLRPGPTTYQVKMPVTTAMAIEKLPPEKLERFSSSLTPHPFIKQTEYWTKIRKNALSKISRTKKAGIYYFLVIKNGSDKTLHHVEVKRKSGDTTQVGHLEKQKTALLAFNPAFEVFEEISWQLASSKRHKRNLDTPGQWRPSIAMDFPDMMMTPVNLPSDFPDRIEFEKMKTIP